LNPSNVLAGLGARSWRDLARVARIESSNGGRVLAGINSSIDASIHAGIVRGRRVHVEGGGVEGGGVLAVFVAC
jgi:hypothetical protein